MSIPEEHKKFFEAVVKRHIEEHKEQLVKLRKSLRLLDKEKTEPEYCIIITSYWKNVSHSEDEKDVELIRTGSLRDVVHDAEKQFMKINRRSDVQGQYYVGMKVGGIVFPLLSKMWAKYKKRK